MNGSSNMSITFIAGHMRCSVPIRAEFTTNGQLLSVPLSLASWVVAVRV
jgi:hypothetical protein